MSQKSSEGSSGTELPPPIPASATEPYTAVTVDKHQPSPWPGDTPRYGGGTRGAGAVTVGTGGTAGWPMDAAFGSPQFGQFSMLEANCLRHATQVIMDAMVAGL